MLNRFTTIFSGVVITGLSVGLLLMSRPMITEANFETKMQESIDSAFHYSVMESNTKMIALLIIHHANLSIYIHLVSMILLNIKTMRL